MIIADYLNIDVQNILGSPGTESTPELTDRDRKDIEKDVINIMEKLTSGEDGPASYGGEPASEEAKESIRNALAMGLEYARKVNREKYNPYKNKK